MIEDFMIILLMEFGVADNSERDLRNSPLDLLRKIQPL